MDHTYTVTSLKCQFCSGRSHCAQCSAEIQERLRRCAGVDDAAVDLGQKQVRISGAEEDALLDALDDAGLLIC